MKKIPLILLTAVIFSFVSCDKIDEDNYVNYSGTTGKWYDDINPISDKSQRVYLEKYTGSYCVNCPSADAIITSAIEKYGNRLIVVAIHPAGNNYAQPHPGDPDLRSEDGATWAEYFKANGLPAAMVNRTGSCFTPSGDIDSKISANLNKPDTLAIAAECRLKSEDMISVTARIEFLQQVDAPLNITILLIEDSIITKQSDLSGEIPNYSQNHVLRKVITPVWGAPVDADGKVGTRRYATFDSELANTGWDLTHCHIVAFITNRENKEVLNVTECDILH